MTSANAPRRRSRRHWFGHQSRTGMARARAGMERFVGTSFWALVKDTTMAGVNYRVTGLAGEAAFFALLSLPPFVLGLLGVLGHLSSLLGPATITEIKASVIDHADLLFTPDAVQRVVEPLLNNVFNGGEVSLISVGFLLALWSGSRALFVYVDLISIAYGLGETRGIIRTRIMSFGLYLAALLIGLVVMPILVVGPTLLATALPDYQPLISIFYWPIVVAGSVLMLTLLYHVSVPMRTKWWREVPGALLALVIWIICAAVLREVLAAWFDPLSIYGSLAAPIAVLLWLYITALAVLIGATLNAEVDRLWPLAGNTRQH
ncbi:YihY/virulence factor BrkB family protein [Herbidospora galbida]|uniref:YihY/virulence factor BrkB family protein n=1 Tax=Herbidospora galbida TaxID=2575442 RepID=A0A4U3MG60_9ACTN|nr:YihY/virulence factor BrkB family protein [Herbidospora galbida]TKK86947.1 YihY/virulence factor BrkB family protein [Herbidospora galbida]